MNTLENGAADDACGVATFAVDWSIPQLEEFARDHRGKLTRPIPDDPAWETECDPALVTRVRTIRRQLLARGFTPSIPRGSAWRSQTEQMRNVLKGVSKTLRSNHCIVRNGKRASRAVDIVPAYWGWEAPRDYWLLLGRLAEREGLAWGGYWGLSAENRVRLRAAVAGDEAIQFLSPSLKLGWDVAHLELL